MFETSLVRLVGVWLIVALVLVPIRSSFQSNEGDTSPDERPVVYLTFGSGPGPGTTDYLDLLDRWEATATFFVVGQSAADSPQLLTEILERGHAIGNHTWTHQDLTRLSSLEALTELQAANRFVAETAGVEMSCWRPPFGEYTEGLIAQAAAIGLDNEGWIRSGRWDVDTRDWEHGYEHVLGELQTAGPGDVVLMHGGTNPDDEDLAALATWLEANGDDYRFEALPGCAPAADGGSGDDEPPDSLAAADPSTDTFATDPQLWFQIQRGSAYLSAFGSTG